MGAAHSVLSALIYESRRATIRLRTGCKGEISKNSTDIPLPRRYGVIKVPATTYYRGVNTHCPHCPLALAHWAISLGIPRFHRGSDVSKETARVRRCMFSVNGVT